jgi:hypothetical protein
VLAVWLVAQNMLEFFALRENRYRAKLREMVFQIRPDQVQVKTARELDPGRKLFVVPRLDIESSG